jgi:hypothetical protein
MGLFEAYPWLLIPLIIVVVELWGALKFWARSRVERDRRGDG